MPRVTRQQRWSPLNVPLMRATAGRDANHPVLEWLENAARRVREPMEFHGGQTTADAAVREGWTVLRLVLRTWGVTSQEQLTDWMVRQGLPRVSVGNHIAVRAQEFILEEAATVDARVALLEATFVMVTIQAGRELTAGEPSHRVPVPRVEPRRPVAPSISAESWEQLDHIDLSEAFTTRVPMLRSCPRFLRGRLRFSLGVALRERSRAKLARDPVAETRAWKLFGLIPMLLLHVSPALLDVMSWPNALTISREVCGTSSGWLPGNIRITFSGNNWMRMRTVEEARQPRVGSREGKSPELGMNSLSTQPNGRALDDRRPVGPRFNS